MSKLSPELRSRIGMNEEGMLQRRFVGEVRIDKENKGIIRASLSSLAVDSYKTITWWTPVDWDGKSYGLNYYLTEGEATFLYEHGGTFRREQTPLGGLRNFEVVGDGVGADTLLDADFVFDMEDAFARSIYRLYDKGFMKGFSQGFRPVKVLDVEESNNFLEEVGRPERDVIIILGETLYEGSAVNFPANVSATVKSDDMMAVVRSALQASGGVTQEDIKQLQLKIMELEAKIGGQEPVKTPEAVGTGYPFIDKGVNYE